MGLDSLTWGLAEGEYRGYPLIIRFRELPQNFLKTKYPQRLNIFGKMVECDAVTGLPTDEESRALSTFEDRLVDAVEYHEHSILVGVLTCNGERELIFKRQMSANF